MPDPEPFVVTPEDVEPFEVPHHEHTTARELVNPERGSDDVVFRLSRMGEGGRDHWHRHEDAEQLLFVRSGEGRIRLSEPGDETERSTHELGPETFVYIPRDTYHQVTNTGDGPLELVVVWAPPYGSLDDWKPED